MDINTNQKINQMEEAKKRWTALFGLKNHLLKKYFTRSNLCHLELTPVCRSSFWNPCSIL